jgi:NADPH:quinone reductase-like Zn-dependent oxidoreductase
MRAWQLTAHGDPRKVLALRELPDPVPGKGQVLVRSEGFGLNYADVMAVKGLYRDAPPPPCVLGYETVGRVERCGEGVPPGLLGQRVVAMTRFGGHAQMVCTDHRAVAVLPPEVDLGTAAAMATQGATAWWLAMVAAPLQPGDRVLVHSAAGGVGHLLVQIAVHRGCEVFAVASGADKLAYLRGLGVRHATDRSVSDVHGTLRKILGNEKLDVAFNAVGGRSFPKDMALLGQGGRMVLYGGAERGAGGPLGTLRFVWNMGLVVPIFLMMKSRSLIGVNMLRLSERWPERVGSCMGAVLHASQEGWLRPRSERPMDALHLPDAMQLLGSGKSIGKVVLRWA